MSLLAFVVRHDVMESVLRRHRMFDLARKSQLADALFVRKYFAKVRGAVMVMWLEHKV